MCLAASRIYWSFGSVLGEIQIPLGFNTEANMPYDSIPLMLSGSISILSKSYALAEPAVIQRFYRRKVVK
jgi:hypothetical protein